jgi:hypothetical protein
MLTFSTAISLEFVMTYRPFVIATMMLMLATAAGPLTPAPAAAARARHRNRA